MNEYLLKYKAWIRSCLLTTPLWYIYIYIYTDEKRIYVVIYIYVYLHIYTNIQGGKPPVGRAQGSKLLNSWLFFEQPAGG